MNKTNIEIITSFWNQHFKYVDTTTTVEKEQTTNLFQKLHGNKIEYRDFTIISGNIGVKGKRANKCKLFLAEPFSQCAKNHYGKNENPPLHPEKTPDVAEKFKRKAENDTPASKKRREGGTESQVNEDKEAIPNKPDSKNVNLESNQTDGETNNNIKKTQMKSGKMKATKQTLQKKIQIRNTIRNFINQHYTPTDNIDRETSPTNIYNFLLEETNLQNKCSFEEFCEHTTRCTEISKIRRGKLLTFKLMPKTRRSYDYNIRVTNRSLYVPDNSIILHKKVADILQSPTTTKQNQEKKQHNDTRKDNNIKSFYKTHYSDKHTTNQIPTIHIYQLYQTNKNYNGETLDEFTNSLMPNFNNTSTIDHKSKETSMTNAQPITATSLKHHDRLDNTNKTENFNQNNIKTDFILANVQGIITQKKNKVQFIRDITTSKNKNQIIALTETWAKDNYDAEFQQHFQDYNIMRSDRKVSDVNDNEQLKTRGGVMILTSPEITITPILEFTNGNCEVAIATLPTINTTVILMYRPSGRGFSLNKYREAIAKINNFLTDSYDELRDKHVILMGDFNFPNNIVQWKPSELGTIADFTEGDSQQKKAFEFLLNMTEENQLEQVVTLPTRGKNTIDLIFTNRPTTFENQSIRILKPLSDHNMVKFQINNEHNINNQFKPQSKQSQPEITTFNFNKGDPTNFKEALNNINWEQVTVTNNTKPVQTLAPRFITRIIGAAKAAKIPLYKQSNAKDYGDKAKYVSQIDSLHRKLDNVHCTTTDRKQINIKIEDINTKIQELHAREHQKKEENAVKKIHEKPQEFFKYANQTKRNKTKIGPLKLGEFYYSGPQQMAQILSDQYKSVFIEPKENYENIKYKKTQVTPISEIRMTKEMFIEAMKSIDPSSSPGPDGVPAYIYHHFAEELANPVMRIWQQSLNSGIMPEGIILAIIVPILKSTDKSLPANYRPIALTNHLTKIFERVLRKVIVKHMEENDLMNRTQHGFRKGHSTVTQILTYYDSILTMLEEGNSVDSVYLDFSKAFDKVDHQILLKKVESLGITGKLLTWIQTFLTNRQQQVRVENTLSSREWVKSGVPQGSVLGPLLFLIMVVDINKDIKDSWIGSYADDTRLWTCIHDQKDQLTLQRDLNTLYKWAEDNNMQYNDNKFEHITYGQQNNRTYLSPNGIPIQKKNTIKDLGVYISSDGKFNVHICNLVKASQQTTAWILRTFRTRNKNVMKTLLKSLIIPKIEYASIIWSPNNQKEIKIIENIQRRFTSRISEYLIWNERLQMPICAKDYWERLKDLKIYSLERRRERFAMLYLYRFIIGIISIPAFEVYSERGIRIRRKLNPKAKVSIKSLRQSSFFYRGPQIYNLLPVELRAIEEIVTPTQENVDCFKKKLDNYLGLIPDQPTIPTRQRAAETNSLLHQIPLYNRIQR